MSDRRPLSIPLLIALVVGVVAVAGVVAADHDRVDVVALLESVCDDDAAITEEEPSGSFVEHYGDASDYARCAVEGESGDIIAFVATKDPYDGLVRTSDGAETGDGIEVSWAVKEDGDEWVIVRAYGSGGEVLEPLEAQGFEVGWTPDD